METDQENAAQSPDAAASGAAADPHPDQAPASAGTDAEAQVTPIDGTSEAIATAARQGNMRFVAIKSEDQQVRLAWHRVREGLKAEVLAISNRIRGLLAEFGVVLPQSHAVLQRWLNDADARAAVPTGLLEALDVLHAQWRETSARMQTCQQRIAEHAQQDARSRRIQQMQGIGCVTADAVVATVGNGQDFNNGRQMAAWIGLTPTQHSTGGKARLGHLARRGDGYLRTLLMQGPEVVCSAPKPSPETRPHPNNSGSDNSPRACPLPNYWRPSPTNTPGNCG